jgi:uncharacterized protein YjbI with pentapeptide repeats
MTKILLISIIMISVFVLFSPCFCQENNRTNLSGIKDSLEIEKLQLENQKMKQDIELQEKNSFGQNGTLIAALIAAIVSLLSAWSSRKSQIESLGSQIEQYQKERISALLRDLGNDKVAVRLGAIQALSNITDDNTDAILSYMVNLLKVDSDPRIRESISIALINMPNQSLPHLLDASKAINERRMRLAIDLILSRKDGRIKDVAEIFSIKSKLIENWMKSPQVHQRKELLRLELLSNINEGKKEEEIYKCRVDNIIKEYHFLCLEANIIVEVSGKIIQKLSMENGKFSLKGAYLPGIILNDIGLSILEISECDLRAAQFINSKIEKANFSGCDLSDSSFTDAMISESSFNETYLHKAIFSRTEIKKTSFNNSIGEYTDFDGSKLRDCRFDKTRLFKGKFKGAEIDGTNFEVTDLFGCVFSGASIKNLSFIKADLGETDLSGLKLIKNVKFIDTSFMSTELNNSNFRDVSFIKSSFKNIVEFGSSDFSSTHWDAPIFGKGTEFFKDYLIKNNIKLTIPVLPK